MSCRRVGTKPSTFRVLAIPCILRSLMFSSALPAFHPHIPSNKSSCSNGDILPQFPATCGHEKLPSESLELLDRRQLLGSFSLIPVSIHASTPVFSLTPEEAATSYDRYSKNYNDLDGRFFGEARSALFGKACGAVLEIGAGTGLNLERYNPELIRSLTLVDISQGMLDEARHRLSEIGGLSGVPIKFIKGDATSELVQRFGERSFDTVVDSFSLCVLGNEGAKRCLEQIKRVVKTQDEGGKVLLIENSRSSNPLLGAYQDISAEAASTMGGKGCVYNQDVGALIRDTKGMRIEEEQQYAAGLFRSFTCFVQ